MAEEMCQANDPVIRSVCACVIEPLCALSMSKTAPGWSLNTCACTFERACLQPEAVCITTLTQHNEVDLDPVVLSPGLDFTVIFPRVGQQQVADQQGGVSSQVLPGEGQTAGLTARRLIGVHLAPEEGYDLDILKRITLEMRFNVDDCTELLKRDTVIKQGPNFNLFYFLFVINTLSGPTRT